MLLVDKQGPPRFRCYECGREALAGPPVRPRAKDRIPRVTSERETVGDWPEWWLRALEQRRA